MDTQKMNLSDIKISVKLGAVFLILVISTAMAGGFAMFELAKINGNTEDMATNWLPSVTLVGDLQTHLNTIRRFSLSQIICIY